MEVIDDYRLRPRPGEAVYVVDGELLDYTGRPIMFGGKAKDSEVLKSIYEQGVQVGARNPIVAMDYSKNAVGRCGFCGGVLVEDRAFREIELREIKCSACGASPAPQRMLERRMGDRREPTKKPVR